MAAHKLMFLLVSLPVILDPKSKRDCLIEDFRKIKEIDDNFKELVSSIIDSYKHVNPESNSYTLSGSTAEGSFTARFFFPNSVQREANDVSISLEFDFENRKADFPSSLDHCVKENAKKQGFVEVQAIKDECFCPQCWRKSVNTIYHFEDKEKFQWRVSNLLKKMTNKYGYLLPTAMKIRRFKRINMLLREFNFERYNFIRALLSRKLTITKVFRKVTKATSLFGFKAVKVGLPESVDFSWEISQIIKAGWTTSITRNWIQRKRNWPPLHFLKEVLQHSFIIAKPSHDEKGNKHTTEHRYSFAHIERKLIEIQPPAQRLIYLIFKSIFYHWVLPLNKQQLSSYLCKSVMLWTCEAFPPSHQLWSDKNVRTVARALRYLFHKLYIGFRNGYLPYFFNRKLNILENISPVTRIHVQVQLYKIKKSVLSYFPRNQKRVLQVLEDIYMGMKKEKDKIMSIVENLRYLQKCIKYRSRPLCTLKKWVLFFKYLS